MEFRHVSDAERYYENYQPRRLESARADAAAAEKSALEAKYFFEFFRKHRDLSPVTSNELIFRKFLREVEITPGSLEEVYVLLMAAEDKGGLAMYSAQTVEHRDLLERRRLIKQILETWDADPSWLANEEKRLNLKNPTTGEFLHPLEELRATLEERQLRAKFAKMSVAELKQITKAPEPEPEILPEKFSPAIVRALSAGQLRQLIGRYGLESVNRRLAGIN